MITVSEVTSDDDLQNLADIINGVSWDEANEISIYEADSLSAYLQRQDTLFVVCHEVVGNEATLLGMAIMTYLIKAADDVAQVVGYTYEFDD